MKFDVLPLLDYKPDFVIDPQTIREDNDNSSEEKRKENKNKFKFSIDPGDLSSYSIIVDQNLFHPERKIVIIEEAKKEETSSEEEVAETDFILYGTLVAGDVRVAFMESKERQLPRSRRTSINRQTIKRSREAQKEKESEPEKPKKRFYEGDVLKGGYTLEKINTEDVILVKGEEIVTVKVYDPANPKKRSSVSSRTLSRQKQQAQQAQNRTPHATIKDQQEKREKMREKINRYRRSRTSRNN